MNRHGNAARILVPGLALGAALLAGALLAADRPGTLAQAPEQVRVRLVSAMAKWRGCLLRVVESRRAEDLRLNRADQDHGQAILAPDTFLAHALPCCGMAAVEISSASPLFLPTPPGRAPPARA